MKILILLPRPSNTSVVRLCKELCVSLSEIYYDSRVIYLSDFLSIKSFRPISLLKILLDANILITCGALSDILSVILCLFKSPPNTFSYIHCFQWPDLKYDKPLIIALPYFSLWRLSLYFKSHIVCVSHAILRKYPTYVRSKSSVIYNHINLSAMAHDQTFAVDSFLENLHLWSANARRMGYLSIFTYGFYVKRKNIHFLISYLSFNSNCTLVLIGGGPLLESYKVLAEKLNVLDRILFIPFLQNPSSLSSFFDVYISPSFSEGFGLANVEAARTGIATIVTDTDVNLEVLSIFPNVHYYNNNSLISLHRVIGKIDFARTMLVSSPSEKFSKHSFVHNWLSLISSYENND